MKGIIVRALFMGAVVSLALFAGAGDLLAQGTETVEFEPLVDFGDIFTTLLDSISPLVAGALGLGLAIWGTRYIFSIIKSMAR